MKTYPTQDYTGDSVLNPAWPQNNRPVGWIQNIVVHHDAVQEGINYPDQARYENEAQYQNGHSIPGSQGIQYHYHVDNIGTITKLRPHEVFLWHCGDYGVNQHSLAVCLDGDFQAGQQTPTREQYEALKQLLDELSTQHPEFPSAQGNVFPHRAFYATNCCGDNLVPFVDGYRVNGGSVPIPDVPYQHPELQEASVTPVVIVPDIPLPPTPEPTVAVPVDVLANEPDYIATYIDEPKQLTTTTEVFAVDMTSSGSPVKVEKGTVVDIAGWFQNEGKSYYRTVYSKAHDKWYGLSFDAFATGQPADTNIPVTVAESSPSHPSLISALLAALAILISPILRVVGRLNKK